MEYHLNERNYIIRDDGEEMLDLYSYFMMSDHSISLAELDGQLLVSPKNRRLRKPETYRIPEQGSEPTLATEDDEDF